MSELGSNLRRRVGAGRGTPDGLTSRDVRKWTPRSTMSGVAIGTRRKAPEGEGMSGNPLREQISELIRQKGPQRLSATIEQSVGESLVLRPSSLPDDKIVIGRSKLGGMPDLPPDAPWPAWNDKHLSFIAQIDLSELPSHGFLETLPSHGVLSFFYSAQQETWGFDPNDKGSWRVLHLEEHDLHRRASPPDLPDAGIYHSCSLEFEVSFTLPCIESPHVDLDFDRPQWDEIHQYGELEESFQQLVGGGSCIHRLLGHPDEMQGYMLRTAQLASHGVYCGGATDDPRVGELEPGAADWELLLQVDSDDNGGMMWGDVGKIYYLMPSEHLRNHDFDAAWMILQCT